MSTISRFMTEDELLRMPDDGSRYELIEGELRQMAPTGYEHGRSTGNLHALIAHHVRLNMVMINLRVGRSAAHTLSYLHE
jgi:Uma2 family endonuclease